jgi:hypothetical protein
MAKLKLQANPFFAAPVAISVPGAADVKVEFTFKHRTRDELDSFLKTAGDLKDADLILAVATGWELDDPYTKENIALLVQNYISSPKAVFSAYLEELVKAREKN